MDPRLSYLHASDNSVVDNELTKMFNPILNLSEMFNSLVGEEGSHLRVFLRVRPVLTAEQEEVAEQEHSQVRILDQHTVLLTAPTSSNTFKNTAHGITKLTHKFSFSHVFGPSIGQVELYEHTTQAMVDKFISGQNCLLFTYGATNSGKTFTVQGTPGNQGLLPRALDGLFSNISGKLYPRRDLKPHYYCSLLCLDEKEVQQEEERKEALFRGADGAVSRSRLSISSITGCNTHPPSPDTTFDLSTADTKEIPGDSNISEEASSGEGIVYAVFVSFAEIYNETVYDLLERLPPGCKKRNPHNLGADRNGSSYIKGLHNVRVDSASEALRVLDIGRQNLHFATTRLNHNSSRSHCIFTVTLVQMASTDTPKYARVSMFSVCDLAGAERAAKTQGSGDRLKEAGNINTSLLVLSRCIVALRQNQLSQRSLLESSTVSNNSTSAVAMKRREVPVPYRDSKLTRLLQNFFLGQGVAAMIVNISQAPTLFDETLQVLKFSAVAKRVITSQEPAPAQQMVVQKPVRKSNSQLSRLLRQSLNKRGHRSSAASSIMNADTSSGRLSVPWIDKSTGKPTDTSAVSITFGEENKEETMLTVMEEEEDDDDEEEDEEDERVQALVEHMTKLTEALKKVNQEKKDLEVRLRSELCSEFSQQLVRVESNWRQRMENQQARYDELHNWRIEKLTEYYNDSTQPRKRARHDDSASEAGDTSNLHDNSLLQFRQQSKLEELEGQVAELKDTIAAKDEERATFIASLKKSTESGNKAQEEATKLKFQLALLTTNYDDLQRRLDSAEKVSASAVPENEALSELQKQLSTSEATVQQLSSELHDNREMLVEAAEAFTLKEEELTVANAALAQYKHAMAEQTVSVEQAVQERDAAQQLASEHFAALEEQEAQLEEKQLQLDSLRQTVRQLREEASAAKASRDQEVSAFKEKELVLVRDKSRLLVEVSELKNKLDTSVSRVTLDTTAEELQEKNKQLEEQNQLNTELLQQEVLEKQKLLVELEKLREEHAAACVGSEHEEQVAALRAKEFDAKERACAAERALIDAKQENASLLENLAMLGKRMACLYEQGHEPLTALQQLQEDDDKDNDDDISSCSQVIELKQQLQRGFKAAALKYQEKLHESELLKDQVQEAKEQLTSTKEQLEVAQESEEELQALLISARAELEQGRARQEKEAQDDEELLSALQEVKQLKDQLNQLKDAGTKSSRELIEAQNKITELQTLVEEKSRLLQQLENIKNENKKLTNTLCENEAVYADAADQADELDDLHNEVLLLHQQRVQTDELQKQVAELTAAKEKAIKQLEENKKVHVSALRYRDCELSTAKKEAEDARQQQAQLRAEKQNLEKKLLELEMAAESQQDTALEALAKELADEKEAHTDTQTRLAAVEKEMLEQKQAMLLLQKKLADAEKCAAASESSNEKLEKLKEDLKRSKESCQMLQKEACAVREARSVEVLDMNNLRSQITQLQLASQQKDDEIVTLQQEIKKALSCSVMPALQSPGIRTQQPVKRDTTEEDLLRDQLRAKDEEVTELLQQLSLVRDQSVVSINTTAATCSLHTTAATTASPPPPPALPPPPSSARNKVGTMSCNERSDDSCAAAGTSSTRRSTRRTRAARPTHTTNTTDDSSHDEDTDTWEPEVTSATAAANDTTASAKRGGRRATASASKRTSRAKKMPAPIYNPHLDNQENKSSLANHCAEEADDDGCSSNAKPFTGRSRRRRPLYVESAEEPLHCSPQLIDPLPPADSPHTVVRRKLRSKPK